MKPAAVCRYCRRSRPSAALLTPLAVLLLVVSAAANDVQEPQPDSATDELRCGSIDIRNSPLFGNHIQVSPTRGNWTPSECTIIEGDFTISMIHLLPNITVDDFPVFSKLREISGYLLVFQVSVLDSLGRMFPQLRIIRGKNMILHYSLIVYQNTNLKEVGLTRLAEITSGGVRIAENPNLCFTESVNWNRLTKNKKLNDVLIEQNNVRCMSETNCARNLPPEVLNKTCETVNKHSKTVACWNSKQCQTRCRCASGCAPATNDGASVCCHRSCAGGCRAAGSAAACHACRSVYHAGECRADCPPDLYRLHPFNRLCVNRSECVGRKPQTDERAPTNELGTKKLVYWKAINGDCTYICPPGYQDNETDPSRCDKCENTCPKRCFGGDVASIAPDQLGKFRDCEIVDGHVTITLHGNVGAAAAEELEKALGSIVEISQYLRVSFSRSLLSLSFLKSLRRIRGKELYNKKYAVTIFENENIGSLFLDNQTVVVDNGTAQFHNNPVLCYQKVFDTLTAMGMSNFSDEDVSRISNGNKAICEEVKIELSIAHVFDTVLVLEWHGYDAVVHGVDHRKFLGYQIFYQPVDEPSDKIEVSAGRDMCQDSWSMQFEPSSGGGSAGGTLIGDLTPNTWYAFYVKTLLINHKNARGGISGVVFQKTAFGVPSSPRLGDGVPFPTSLMLFWDPPQYPNGDITHYIVTWSQVREVDGGRIEQACDSGAEAGLNKQSALETAAAKKDAADPGGHHHQGGGVQNTGGGTNSAIERLIAAATGEDARCRKQQCCACRADTKLAVTSKGLPASASSLISADTAAVDSDKTALLSPQEQWRRAEKHDFENSIQNMVFIRKCQLGNSVEGCDPDFLGEELPFDYDDPDGTNGFGPELLRRRRRRRVKRSVSEKLQRKQTAVTPVPSPPVAANATATIAVATKTTPAPSGDADAPFEIKTVNVTNTSTVLKNLKHFTEYEIRIRACQNKTAPQTFCSELPSWGIRRTLPIREMDIVNASTVQINTTSRRNRSASWEVPRTPNGIILSYTLNISNPKTRSVQTACVKSPEFASQGGVFFTVHDESGGDFELRISTLTTAGSSAFSEPVTFNVKPAARLFPWWVVAAAVAALLAVSALIGALAIVVYKRKVKKLPEYIANMIATCPDYISTLEIYTPDEWELNREDIKLIGEIGHGSFGKVYAGEASAPGGGGLQSHSGVVFTECAVKTVADTATWADRMHFLIEASVMKSFQTPFVVKLYGVVSNGQPALVVMEMMRHGNLRDFLRSRRPDADENVDASAPPSLHETEVWAAQIADGMAYLEAQKFCHRDLAARNCMISANLVAKIGDFGMARDVYAKDYYRPTGKRLMPVRWMSPEALKDAKSTSKSDVWSYGVVLWELVTLAQQPYPGLGNEAVFDFIVEQRRTMERPSGCPDQFFELMTMCWQYEPRDRPTFAELVTMLLPYQDEEFATICYTCNRPTDAEVKDKKRAAGGGAVFFSKAGVDKVAAAMANAGGPSTASASTLPLAAAPSSAARLSSTEDDDNAATVDAASTAAANATVVDETLIDACTPLNPRGAQTSSTAGAMTRSVGDPPDDDSDGEDVNSPVCSKNRREAPRPSWNSNHRSSSKASSPVAADSNEMVALAAVAASSGSSCAAAKGSPLSSTSSPLRNKTSPPSSVTGVNGHVGGASTVAAAAAVR